jgi:hypothetical protein
MANNSSLVSLTFIFFRFRTAAGNTACASQALLSFVPIRPTSDNTAGHNACYCPTWTTIQRNSRKSRLDNPQMAGRVGVWDLRQPKRSNN